MNVTTLPETAKQRACREIAEYVANCITEEFFAADELPEWHWLQKKLREAGVLRTGRTPHCERNPDGS